MNFLHPGLLGLAGLFAVPLIIHLLNKRRFQRVRWAAMDFLLRAHKQNRRRVRLENLLLLLLRCAIPILLALAISRPRTDTASAAALGSMGKHHVVLVDRSYSMGYSEGDSGSPFDRMKIVVSRLIDHVSSKQDDKFSFVFFDDQIITPIRGDLDVAKAKRALTALDGPRDGKSLLLPALKEAQDLIGEEAEPTILYVFSDFQRLAFGTHSLANRTARAVETPEKSDPSAKEKAPSRDAAAKDVPELPSKPKQQADEMQQIRDLLGDLKDQDVQIRLLPFTPATTTSNSQVTSLAIEPANAVARVACMARATVIHRGPDPRDVIATLLVDGKNPQTKTLGLQPGQEKTLEFPVRFLNEGRHLLELSLADDGLTVDDTRRLSVRVRDRIRVLLVEGRDDDGQSPIGADDLVLSQSFLWRSMLDPTDGEGGEELLTFQASVEPEDRFQADPSFFTGPDVIALLGVSAPRPTVAKRLLDFVAGGGGLLILPGPNSSADLFNSRLFGREGEKGPLPLRLLDVRGFRGILGNVLGGTIPDRYSTPDILLEDHDLLADFKEQTRGEILQRTPIYRYFGASLVDKPEETEVVLGLSDTEDSKAAVLLAVRPYGRGQCALLTSGITKRPDRWNRLDDIWNSLPLIHSIAHYLAKETPDRQNRLVGEGLGAWLPDRPSALYMTMPGSEKRTPLPIAAENRLQPGAGDTVKESEQVHFGFRTPSFLKTNRVGVYTLQAEFADQTLAARSIPFAVNADPREGLLDYLSANELMTQFPMAKIQTDLELESGVDVDTGSSELGAFMLLLVLIFAFSETVLAAIIGGKRR